MSDDGAKRTHPPADTDPPAVASPGDSDAPDAPDADTVYPDARGVPGDPDE